MIARLSNYLLFCALFLLSHSCVNAQELLMVINSSSISSQEQERKTQFEAWGYNVTTIVDSDTQANYNTALATSDVVYVSQDVISGDVSYKLRETAVGVVSSEGWLDNELGFSTNDPYVSSQTQIYVTDSAHEVSAGLPNGFVTIFTSNNNRVLMSGTGAAGMSIHATSSSGATLLATLEVGAVLANSSNGNNNAAGRRVRLPWGSSSFDFSDLNSTGLDLVQRAIAWAADTDPTGLQVHLRLDETSGTTANDSSGKGNHGTYEDGVTIGELGVRNLAASFDGNNRRISIPGGDDLNFNESVSVACWAKSDTENWNTAGMLVSKRNQFILHPSSGKLIRFFVHSGSWKSVSIDAEDIQGWHQYVGTYDHTTGDLNLYIDKELKATTNLGAGNTLTSNTSDIWIGSDQCCGSRYFEGDIDDVVIYNRVMTQEEIIKHFGLIGHWKLDEVSGSTAYDSSGLDHDGTYTGGVDLNVTGPGSGEASIAADFDGNNDYVDLPSMQHDFTDGVAASMWVKSTSTPANNTWQAFLSLANGTYNDEVWFGWRKGRGLTYWGTDHVNGSSTETMYDYQDFALNSWTHVIINVDSDGYATFYQNGIATTGAEFISLPTSVNRSFTYIADSVWNENFEGSLFDVRLYNRPLTSEEIAEISSLNQSGTGIRIQSWQEIQ